MGLFGNKIEKQKAAMLAPQLVKIMNESRTLVNNTTEPKTFFSRYDLLREKSEELVWCSKYVKLKGTPPAMIRQQIIEQEEAATHDFILRFYAKKMATGKTDKKYEAFRAALEPYFFQLSVDNINLVEGLHEA